MPLDTARLNAMMLRRAPDSVRVVWGSLITYGTLRSSGELDAQAGGFVPITSRALLLAATAFPGITPGAQVTVAPVRTPTATTTYEVRSPALAIENGELVRYLIVPVS